MKIMKKLMIGGGLLMLIFLQSGCSSTKEKVSKDSSDKTRQQYSHGSDEIVSEPDNTVPDSYSLNTKTQGSAKENDYEKLFDTESIETVDLTISENNWNYLLQNAIDTPYVLASELSIGSESIENIGIKTKGNMSLRNTWDSDSDRFSFTVNFGKYIKKKDYGEKQNFYGLEKVSFNSMYGDPTLMKEYLSYLLMTEMGLDTPYYSLVKLNVNGEYWGVYLMLETISDPLIERTLGSSDGFLAKPESPGGDLVYDYDLLDQYLENNNTYNMDIATYSDKDNFLSNYTGIWDRQANGVEISDYEEADEEEKAEIETNINNVLLWMKKLNDLSGTADANTSEYQRSLEKIVDVDKLARYFAANTYLVNLDSYQSRMQQNYGFYLVENQMTILPWDYNLSFGGYGFRNSEDAVNFSITEPVLQTEVTDRPLLNVLLQNDTFNKLYQKYLADCVTIVTAGGTTSDNQTYQKGHFASYIEKFKTSLTDLYADDPTAFYTVDEYKKGTEALVTFMSERSTAVTNQLNGDTTKVTSDIDFSELGGMDEGPNKGGGPGNGGEGMQPPEGEKEGAQPPDGENEGRGTPPPDGEMPYGEPPSRNDGQSGKKTDSKANNEKRSNSSSGSTDSDNQAKKKSNK